MSFSSILIGLVTNTVKSATNLSLSIDNLISKFDKGCPTETELIKIIKEKNRISSALTSTRKNVVSLNKNVKSIEKTVSILQKTVSVLGSYPLPVSFPPGAGLPTGFILRLSLILNKADTSLSSTKNILQLNSRIFNTINTPLLRIQNRINVLNEKILNCAPTLSPEIVGEVNNVDEVQDDINKTLDGRIQPNSLNPLIYKNYRIEVQYNLDKKYAVPQRKIIGRHLFTKEVLSGDYSFSSSTEVLVDELKYQIDLKEINQQ
jgi:hypothetical protein